MAKKNGKCRYATTLGVGYTVKVQARSTECISWSLQHWNASKEICIFYILSFEIWKKTVFLLCICSHAYEDVTEYQISIVVVHRNDGQYIGVKKRAKFPCEKSSYLGHGFNQLHDASKVRSPSGREEQCHSSSADPPATLTKPSQELQIKCTNIQNWRLF